VGGTIKVFISWSGTRSHEVAKELGDAAAQQVVDRLGRLAAGALRLDLSIEAASATSAQR
jgi:hypothetical protein